MHQQLLAEAAEQFCRERMNQEYACGRIKLLLSFHTLNCCMLLTWHNSDEPPHDEGIAPSLRLHHPYHRTTLSSLGRQVQTWSLRDDDFRLRGMALIEQRRWPGWGQFAVLARGPVWGDDLSDSDKRQALEDLLALLRTQHRGVMAAPDQIGGADPLDDAPWLAVVTEIGVAELNLDAPPEVLRARQSGKFRNRVRKAEANDISVTHAPWPADPDHWLLRAETRQRRMVGYKGLDSAYTLAWANIHPKASTRLFVAKVKGIPVAAMLFLLHAPGATYHIAWTDETGRNLGAHPLLMWRAILWLSTHGYSYLDLDVIDTVTNPGLARFKLGTGAHVTTTGATRLWAPGTGLVRRIAETRRAS